jgi:N-acetylmuramoyl-L-alanine amidase
MTIMSLAIINNLPYSVEGMREYARSKKATDKFIEIAEIYGKYASSVGVDPVGAYCQAAKETGFGKFGGVLDESYCNPCGMKKRTGGGDYDKEAHQRFASWEDGVKAHVDHLALYAGASGYPKKDTTDPRHFVSIFGTAKTFEDLTGKWATNPKYGTELIAMVDSVNRNAESSPIKPSQELIDAIDELIKVEVIKSPEYWLENYQKLKYIEELIIAMGKYVRR